jgi:hypothetical protein
MNVKKYPADIASNAMNEVGGRSTRYYFVLR